MRDFIYKIFGFLLITLSIIIVSRSISFGQSIKIPEVKKEVEEDTFKPAADSASGRSTSFSDPISYSAADSLVYDFMDTDTMMYLYKSGNINSIGMDIKADYMELSKKKGTIFASGVPDTAGVAVGKPVFKQGSDELQMDSLTYNYQSKKARVFNVSTKQGDGFLYGEVSKRMPDNSSFIKGAKYTTCDAEHPHFYIYMTEGKVTEQPKKYIYFGPSYLVIEDVPFPLVLPFGLFPQQSGRASGIRIPTYGEENARGFFLRNFGYYQAIGDNMDLDLLGDYYTLGSYSIRANSRYVKRYKYEGTFNLEYADNKTGDKGSMDYQEATTFSVRWTHRMSPKARPGTTFSANVNFSSANNNKYNNNIDHDPYQAVNNTISSSISYGRSWQGSPVNLSVNASHSQNMRDSTYVVTLPNVTFNLTRIYPLARKERVGKKRFYEEVSLTYNATFDNKVSFKSSELANSDFGKKINNGVNHRFSIGLPTATLFKYIQITPGVSYGMRWYFKDVTRKWDDEARRQIRDTTQAFSTFGILNEYSFSISANTQLYGIFNFRGDGPIKAIRHVMKPSISLSFQPDMKTHANGWRTVQIDSTGRTETYNIYDGQPYGVPSQTKAGSISFSLGNNLEMKVRNRQSSADTAQNEKGDRKIALLNTFDLSGSYNLLADSMNLSQISLRGSTNLPGKTALNFGLTFDPYAINERGTTYDKYLIAEKGGLNLARLTRFDISFGYSFNGGKDSKTSAAAANAANANTAANAANAAIAANPDRDLNRLPPTPINNLVYEDFSIPWSISFNYSYNYSRNYTYANETLIVKHNHMQTLNFNGQISPTPNWSINFNSGFDLKQYKLTMTNINLSRKLHCFNFTFNWTPFGTFKCWSFRIGILSSMLSDVLKYDKRESYYDNPNFW